MPSPTVQAIKDYARQRLGDTRVSGGAIYTDDGSGGKISLQQPFEAAYRLLYRVLDEAGAAFVNRNLHFLLPAHSGYVDPTATISNFGEPVSLRTRLISSSLVISALTADPNAQECAITTASPHTLLDGDRVMIYGLTDAGLDRINDEWTVNVVDDDQLKLLGCTASGTYTSGGVLVVPSGEWSRELIKVDDPADLRLSPFVNASYSWERDRFILLSNPVDRILRIRFSLSGTPPTSDSADVLIDDSIDFFGTYTASRACSVNAPTLSQSLLAEAI